MRNQMLLTAAATLGLTIFPGGDVLAAAAEAAPPENKSRAPAEKPARAASSPKKVSPAPAVEGVDAPYRCRPDEDIACTFVRETAQGVLIVTFRPAGAATERKTWAVVSGAPAGMSAAGGGTVYVIPSLPQNLAPSPSPAHGATAVTQVLPNGAPIIE